MNQNTDELELYELKTYYAVTIDPIHVGIGGTRLERVDLPILRDPATRLPKIPGTSISGAARANTALATGRYSWKEGNKEFSCAGKGGEAGEKHCGSVDPACPVCVPYGFSKGTSFGMQGLAQFFDAHIFLFPVYSMIGPVWVTSPSVLGDTCTKTNILNDEFCPLGEKVESKEKLNFGWIMLEKINKDIDREPILRLIPNCIPTLIRQRIALVSDAIFIKIVNSNLEVRTSVSIDPGTGAAEDGALFTYEAIPRGTILRFDVVYNSGKNFEINGKKLKVEGGVPVTINWVKTQVENGFKLFEILGIGGMNTRGMGRMKLLDLERGGENE